MTAPQPRRRTARHRATPSPVGGIIALILIVALAAIASALVKVDPHNLDQSAPSSRFSAEAGLTGGAR
ncbi:hypothetical protein [Oerskovia paurometabola]|uniref:Uncharacterized protein n=1 Tax=Oerskovia paurometabola TaxID=162170 RepID=A0ABW1X7S0_9CELL|nr:hypothetical protein [Oerskovia paurometabola]MBM7497785.1 hypothetical protein [Oerskovia paurometabola]